MNPPAYQRCVFALFHTKFALCGAPVECSDLVDPPAGSGPARVCVLSRDTCVSGLRAASPHPSANQVSCLLKLHCSLQGNPLFS